MIKDNILKTDRHTTFYLSGGDPEGTPILFVHGWPELSHSWRGQLSVFAALGFRVIAPDMRGYGRSGTYEHHEAFCLEEIAADMIELLDHLGIEETVLVGHDWGAPVVWSFAQHYPERCLGVAGLSVPYIPEGFAVETLVPLVNRKIYPEDQFPVGQWDYQFFYRENFAEAQAHFETDIAATVRALFRAGVPEKMHKPGRTARIRHYGGWFGGTGAPDLPRDERVISETDEKIYAEALVHNGFFGPNSWYMNGPANREFALQARRNWILKMPVLFLHGKHDSTCETLQSMLAHPMRRWCEDLSEEIIPSGHWMAQEQPVRVNGALVRWLVQKLPDIWQK